MNITAYYANVLKGWAKGWGSKPTGDMFTVVHTLPGPNGRPKALGVEALYLAMCLRPEGCTVPQFMAAGAALKGAYCGPANNTRRAYRDAGLLAETTLPAGSVNAKRLTLTAKGKAALKAAMAAAAAAAKAEAKAAKPPKAARKLKLTNKPRKPVVAPVTPPVAPVTADTATH